MLKGITILATIVGMTWMALLSGASIAIGARWYVTGLMCVGTLFLGMLLSVEVRGDENNA